MQKEIKEFEARFDSKEKEVLVLTEEGASAGKTGQNKMWEAIVIVLAVIDVATGELIKDKKRLTWLLTDEQCKTTEKIFGLEGEKIYRLKVQESLEFVYPLFGNIVERGAQLWVREVLERECHDDRLQAILEKYQQPVTLQANGCEIMELDKSLGSFFGEGVWNGCECSVSFDVDDENDETAEDALATWNKLLENCAEWDDKARKYAAQKLVGHANDWLLDDTEEGEEVEEITEEAFASRMQLSDVSISTEGDFEIFYNDDDMFWGHVIIVSGNIDDGLDDAIIAG